MREKKKKNYFTHWKIERRNATRGVAKLAQTLILSFFEKSFFAETLL